MSRARVSSSTFAFCASLVLHAGLVYALVARYVHDLSHIYLAGFVSTDVPWSSVALEPSIMPAPADDDTALGERTGRGDAINPAEGDRPHQAPRAEQSQLFLSRDPEGFEKVGDPPSLSVLPEGVSARHDLENAEDTSPRVAFGVGAAQEREVLPQSTEVETSSAAPNEPSTSKGAQLAQSKVASSVIAMGSRATDAKSQASDPAAPGQVKAPAPDDPPVPTAAPTPAPPAAPTAASLAISRQSPDAQQQQQQSTNNTAAPVGAPVPSADPAPMADSESDPFSKTGSVRFVAGRAEVQFGRKHRIVRPQLSLAAKVALVELPSPIVVQLRLHLDAAGNVTRVDIAKSTGSSDVDQAIKVAAYQWWLEPSRDHDGVAVADVIPFVVRFD